MRIVIISILLVMAIAAQVDCLSAPGNMTKINPINIPSGMTPRETAAAIVQTIVKVKITPGTDRIPRNNWEGVVNSLLNAGAWGNQNQLSSGSTRTTLTNRGWYVESIEANEVVLGFKNRRYYMSVQMAMAGDKVIPTILISENLRQRGDNIHPSAIEWLSNISADIRKTLGYLSILKAQMLEGVPTGELSKVNPIAIPHGMTPRETAAAIVQTIVKVNLAPGTGRTPRDNWEAMVDSLLNARIRGYQSQFTSDTMEVLTNRNGWYIEAIEPGTVMMGYKEGQRYMSVRMDIAGNRVTPSIVISENLNQQGENIDKRAIEWLAGISADIRKELGNLSVLKSQILEGGASGDMTNINPVIIPSGLTPKEAAAAVVQTVAGGEISLETGIATKNDWESAVDSLLRKTVLGSRSLYASDSTMTSNGGWYVEAVEPDAVILGFKDRQYYMSVRMAMAGGKVTPAVLLSENLNQQGNGIDSRAIELISSVSSDIRKKLGEISVVKSKLFGGENSSPLPGLGSPATLGSKIAKKAYPSIVFIGIDNGSGGGSGSGFVIGNGLVATNYHVIGDANHATVRIVDQQREFPVSWIRNIDPKNDLAILVVQGLKAPALALGDSDKIERGSQIFVIGNPNGLEGTISDGLVAAIRKEGLEKHTGPLIQISAPISPGNSGGPVLDATGKVIGIAVLASKSIIIDDKTKGIEKVTGMQNLNFAVPVNELKRLRRERDQRIPLLGRGLIRTSAP